MISRVYLLSHLEILFTAIYSALPGSLLDNIFLQAFLRIFNLTLVLIKPSTIGKLTRNM